MLYNTRRLMAAAVAMACVMAPVAAWAQDGATLVTVYANALWQPSGVSIQAPCTIQHYSGDWSADPTLGLFDANGNRFSIGKPGYPAPGHPEGMLIGEIGGTIVPIGMATTTPDGLSGELKLIINDDIRNLYGVGLQDNRGAIIVKITCP